MDQVISKDGTIIAFDRSGNGPDKAIMGNGSVPTERLASITVPTLVIDGGASPAFMHNAAQSVAHALPNAQYRMLEGQTHDVAPEALAPVLIEFFMENIR